MDITKLTRLDCINKMYEGMRSYKRAHLLYLNANQIGQPCERALWYQFRHAWTPKQKLTYKKNIGFSIKELVREDLSRIGATVWDRDPKTGAIISFTAMQGHISIFVDGVVKGLKEAPDKAHILFIMPCSDINFRLIEENAVIGHSEVLHDKIDLVMYISKIDRALFIAVNKDSGDIYGERLKLSAKRGKYLVEKAKRIVEAVEPPQRIGDSSKHPECRRCLYFGICQGCKIPEANCRTCCHSTPEKDGTWSCGKGHEFGAVCEDHLFIPPMMPKDLQATAGGADFVEYTDDDTGEIITNKGNSQELHLSRIK